MYCPHCGKEIADDAVVCVGCGREIKAIGKPADKKWSGGILALLIILTIFIPLVGIIAGIVGLTKEAKRSQGGILLGLGILMLIIWLAVQMGA